MPTATATATAMLASPTPSATPRAVSPYAWEKPPSTGVAHVDAIVRAMVTADAAALAPYLIGTPGKFGCGRQDGAIWRCPPGLPDGSMLPSIPLGGVGGPTCVGGAGGAMVWANGPASPGVWPAGEGSTYTPLMLARDILDEPWFLRSARSPSEAEPGVFLVSFQGDLWTAERGVTLAIDDRGVVRARWWDGGTCATGAGDLVALSANPPSSPRPASTPTPIRPR